MTLTYLILDSTYKKKKIDKYMFIYKYTKILQFGALASWGLKNKFMITNVYLFIKKQQDIFISLHHILRKSTPEKKKKASFCTESAQ